MVETTMGKDQDQLPLVLQNDAFDWVCLTSPEAAAVFINGWTEAGKPNVNIAVVGKGTGKILSETGDAKLEPAFTPSVVRLFACGLG